MLFDLGGTLHVSDSPEGRDIWFARRLLDRLADYGIRLDVPPEELARKLHENGEAYKHHSEKDLRELPPAEIWSAWYLRDWDLGRDRLAPIAEELSFLYDYERVRVVRRPYIKETLDALREQGMKLGLISNIISLSVAPHFLEEYGVRDYMDCIVLSSATGIRKPSADIFRVAEKELDLGPEELAYVGDTLSRDVMGTRNAGWRLMIQIKNPGAARRDKGLEHSGLKPDCLVEGLEEIPEIIRKVNEKP
ncbi:MAG: HAD family hydrolase [Oscillospiraceae bacterium]|nr:HAD family hydrolase [Oscillospiraceae bacterium]